MCLWLTSVAAMRVMPPRCVYSNARNLLIISEFRSHEREESKRACVTIPNTRHRGGVKQLRATEIRLASTPRTSSCIVRRLFLFAHMYRHCHVSRARKLASHQAPRGSSVQLYIMSISKLAFQSSL